MIDGTKLDEFKEFVAGLECTKGDTIIRRLDHGVCGCCSEAGELMGEMKKLKFYLASLDEKLLKKFKTELSDNFHYITMLVNILEMTFDELIELNEAKLNARYPDGYSNECALNRDLEKEERAIKDGESKDN